jgi:hypothetical protein
MIKIAHITNPVLFKDKNSVYAIKQPIAFESVRVAKNFSKGKLAVELFSAQYIEDRPIVPKYFRKTPDLVRSVLDFKSMKNPRKLPLIKDILDKLYECSDADFFIYTNSNVCLQKDFYLEVEKIIKRGFDAFIINKRMISEDHLDIKGLNKMYLEEGTPHPGFDCFVFKRELYPRFQLGNTCIAAPMFDSLLLLNMAFFSKKFELFKYKKLTFQLGTDNNKPWKNKASFEYEIFNAKQAIKIIRDLGLDKINAFNEVKINFVSSVSKINLFYSLKFKIDALIGKIGFILNRFFPRIYSFLKSKLLTKSL